MIELLDGSAPQQVSVPGTSQAPRFHVRVLAGSLAPTAGSHLYNRELIRRLSERGHRVSVIAFDADEELRSFAEVVTLPKPKAESLPVVWRMQTWIQAALFSRQLNRAPLDRPDLVIASEHLFLRPHARRFPRTPWLYLPHSWTIAEEIESYGLGGWLGRFTKAYYVRQQRWAAAHASKIVRFNRAAASALSQALPRSRRIAEMVINPPGINLPSNTPRLANHNRPFRFLFVGRLAASKNVDLILRSLASITNRDWTLDIVGDGPERGRLEVLTGELHLGKAVRFHGHQRDVGCFYAQSDLLVFPSRLESQGLVILEAMSHGIPALVIREDGKNYRSPFSEVIADGVTGFLARDEADFAARLGAALRDREAIASMGETARRDVEKRYCWERHLDQYESLFEELTVQR